MIAINYTHFPLTEPPSAFTKTVVEVFRSHEEEIGTANAATGLKSDEVLSIVRADLEQIGFDVESGKADSQKINRPVFSAKTAKPRSLFQSMRYARPSPAA
ncbi:MAG: hypothetical protein AAF328_02185 [Planctomycetota bacterium]